MIFGICLYAPMEFSIFYLSQSITVCFCSNYVPLWAIVSLGLRASDPQSLVFISHMTTSYFPELTKWFVLSYLNLVFIEQNECV